MTTIKAGNKEYSFEELGKSNDLKTLIGIDPVNISNEAISFPLIVHSIGYEKIQIQSKLRLLEQALEIAKTKLVARLESEYREKKSEQKLTEANIKSFISSDIADDPELIDLNNQINEQRLSLAYIENIFWAAKDKIEILKRVQI